MFKEAALSVDSCLYANHAYTYVNNFTNTILSGPGNPLTPSVSIKASETDIFICESNNVIISEIFNDGNRGFKKIEWRLVGSSDDNLEDIL